MKNKVIRKIQLNHKIKKDKKAQKSAYRIMLVSLTILFFVMSIGYAALLSSVEITGSISAYSFGEMFTSDVLVDSYNGVTQNTIPTYTNTTLSINNNFSSNDYSYITYEVTIANATSDYQRFTGVEYNATESVKEKIKYELSNDLEEGDRLAPGDSITFTVTLSYASTASEGQYILSLDFQFQNDGAVYATINTTEGDLTGSNTKAPFVVTVYNSSTTDVTFAIQGDNNSFVTLNDSNGNALSSFTIGPNTNQSYNVYAMKVDGARYQTNSVSTMLTLNYNSIVSNIDTITLSVDINYIPDTTIPSISNVTLTRGQTEGNFTVNWTRTDTGGTDITNYGIKLYNSSNTLISSVNTNNSNTSYTFTGQSENTYYALVYGEDEAGNSGNSYCNTSSSSTYCAKSSNTLMKWRYSVTHSLTNLASISDTTALVGSTYNVTLSKTGNYSLPTSITVKMGNTTLTSGTDYTYNSTSGAVSIPNISGDVVITAAGKSSGICLVEGTLIKLADGSLKKIEDINYDDLLLVWSYETGEFVYEYPIWIEKTSTIDSYQETTFSDNSTLKTVGFHGVFSKDKNMFISVDDYDNFKVGTNIVKFDNNNQMNTVSIKKIEQVNKKVNYYHVVSTRYYNIIANDFLTTDGTVMLSNLYGFNDNITWTDIRKEVISKESNLYTYDEMKEAIPYYMYKGLRTGEGKFLETLGYLTKDMFLYYLFTNQNNTDMLKEPIKNSDGANLWMVTTSNDIVNSINKSNYLFKEGDYYTLPKSNKDNFKYWYNTADGNYYNENDKVQIWHGTYFKEVLY